ncbi:MAG TPA: STAS domain-containing protein [Gammaproteobacteria bacterium]|nr:STAS domain-containing protein [Gammaproteobacteria bacterium]MCP5436460.1 STAS domain-containing protein [Chromatiaceae bacterium]HOP15955.1 STAS domain-containing protein [Gammaproteobacteria bacterium]HPQ25282.1 STAS domain-containing protein [Gammaproteobacteria bacterium]
MSKKQPVMSHDPLAGLSGDSQASATDGPSPDEGVEPSTTQARGVSCVAGGEALLVLPASLTIAEVGEMHTVLMNHLGNAAAVKFDGSSVEIIDGAGLQLLTAFVKTATEKALMVTWHGASETLGQAARRIGVDSILKLPDQQLAA